MSDGVIVGIDLGTTNSAVGCFHAGAPRLFENPLGEVLTPSAVAKDPRSGEVVVGRTAKDILALHPDAGAAFFKRLMGSDAKLTLAGEPWTPVELSACVLKALKADAERALGEAVGRCVISVPAYFDEAQRLATRSAAELAELSVERIINEPTAAAIAYGFHRKSIEQLFLVFDLGGGTLDVCVMELFEGSLEVRSTAGLSNLGGEDFTARLRSRCLQELKLVGEHAELADPGAMALLYARCELAKRQLGAAGDEALTIHVPPIAGMLADAAEVQLTGAQVEESWRSLLDQVIAPVRSALRGASISTHDVEKVIFVGGATRMGAVRKVVDELLRREVLDGIDPDLTVVHGATVQAALCADDEAVADIVVTDVASHSLGINYTKELADTHVDGYFAPIIHRNTALPTSRTKSFLTLHRNQRAMDLEIYEGEARRAKDNRKIGTLKVKGIPKGPPGQEVEVTFTFDLNGILQVDAKVSETGQVFTAVFERSGQTLEGKELEAAKVRLSAIRADPTERPEIRDLLARADLLCQDLVGPRRELLEAGISALEEAILTRTPRLIEQAAEQLRAMCDQLGGERW
jgi:molecular chaperone HscC